MSGVEILSQQSKYEWGFGSTVVLSILIVILFILIVLAISCLLDGDIGCVVGTVIAIVLVIIGGNCVAEKTAINYIEYKVTIDDSVSINDLTNVYQIIDQDGRIYTVREK